MVIPPPIQYERDEAAPSASSLSLARALSLKSISICLAYADVRCIFDDVITVAKVWQRRWRWIACLCTKSKINVEVTDGVHRPPPPYSYAHTHAHTHRDTDTHTHTEIHTHTHTQYGGWSTPSVFSLDVALYVVEFMLTCTNPMTHNTEGR